MARRGGSSGREKFVEPSYSDPEMQRIALEIVKLRKGEANTDFRKIFKDSFVLPAQLGDARRKSRGQEEFLVASYENAWKDDRVKPLYSGGKNGDVSHKGEHQPQTEEDRQLIREYPHIFKEGSSDDAFVTPCRELLGIHFDPRAIDVRLLRSLIKSVEHGGEKQWESRMNDLDAVEIPDGIKALLFLDLLANEARQLIRQWLRTNQRPDPTLPLDFTDADRAKEVYVQKLQSKIEPKMFQIAYLKGLEERLSGMVNERAAGLYKEKAEEMMDLWRTVNYLVSSKFTQGDVSEFRQSVYGALKDRNTQKARQLIRPRMLKNPDAFTPAAHRTLEVTEDDLKATRIERGQTRKMSQTEKLKYKEIQEQRREEEVLAPLKPFVGKMLFDKTHDRFILCLGLGKISRTRTSYDKKSRTYVEVASDIPGMEVRYFPRPEEGKPAQARKEDGIIKPGAFLAYVESGAYELRDDIHISKDAREIGTTLFPKPSH